MERTIAARDMMMEFARFTGLSPITESPRRYLWTDAFAVCNFLGLHQETKDGHLMNLALELVDQVHSTLGRYRQDDTRSGWISGLGEREAKARPTAGGLRIGKQLRERRPTEPLDERVEWDRDGQYFHYLTKWMHALDRLSRATRELIYRRWAIELARVAHSRFVYSPPSGKPKRMYWKMSTDLSYPLVQSMGLHDPLDGMITYMQLASAEPGEGEHPAELNVEIAEMADMCRGRSWVTHDTLGIGGLLTDGLRVARLIVSGHAVDPALLPSLLNSSLAGLELLNLDEELKGRADYRLPFRELGLSIGLRAVPLLGLLVEGHHPLFGKAAAEPIERLRQYEDRAGRIEDYWMEPAHHGTTWSEHREINMVMLATSLSPSGYLGS